MFENGEEILASFARSGYTGAVEFFALSAGEFLLLYIFFASLGWVLTRHILPYLKIGAIVDSRPLKDGQIGREIRRSLVSIAVFGAYGVLTLEVWRTGLIHVDFHASWLKVASDLALFFVWNEIHFYCIHRMLHTRWLYRHVHRVHHESVVPTPFSIYSFHWLEAVLLGSVMILALMVFRPSVEALIGLPLTSLFFNTVGHCNYNVFAYHRSIHSAAVQHSNHHLRVAGNYGFYLPVLDRVLNTALWKKPLTMNAFITSMGVFLPGEPVGNDAMEDYLGRIGGKPSRVRQRILKQNGIHTRYYAIDREQKTLFSNSEMAARAVRAAIDRGSFDIKEIDYLCAAATSQGDFPLPGFASTVHAELDIPPCEIATFHGVCASGVMALRAAMLQVLGGGKNKAMVCASEFASRLFKASRFEAQAKLNGHCLGFDTEFLRWMLSDGAGAAVVERTPSSRGLCFGIEWIELKSFANRFDACMYVGPEKNNGEPLKSAVARLPQLSRSTADDGAINLRQDIRLLGDVVRCTQFVDCWMWSRRLRLDASSIDWLVAHYSSHVFRDESYELAAKGGLDIPHERWFTNLYSKGNVGSASIFVLLEELLHSDKLKPGQTVLCLVPESGRFLFGYMLLRVREGKHGTAADPMPRTEPPPLDAGSDPLAQSLVRQLAQVWFEFEDRLHRVPIVAKLNQGRFTVEDYKSLLFNLRQQVIDGSRWIARAASNITGEYFPIRSAFIAHTSDEHRDFEMLERNYAACGRGRLRKCAPGERTSEVKRSRLTCCKWRARKIHSR